MKKWHKFYIFGQNEIAQFFWETVYVTIAMWWKKAEGLPVTKNGCESK